VNVRIVSQRKRALGHRGLAFINAECAGNCPHPSVMVTADESDIQLGVAITPCLSAADRGLVHAGRRVK
jgi:hypothetical protein